MNGAGGTTANAFGTREMSARSVGPRIAKSVQVDITTRLGASGSGDAAGGEINARSVGPRMAKSVQVDVMTTLGNPGSEDTSGLRWNQSGMTCAARMMTVKSNMRHKSVTGEKKAMCNLAHSESAPKMKKIIFAR